MCTLTCHLGKYRNHDQCLRQAFCVALLIDKRFECDQEEEEKLFNVTYCIFTWVFELKCGRLCLQLQESDPEDTTPTDAAAAAPSPAIPATMVLVEETPPTTETPNAQAAEASTDTPQTAGKSYSIRSRSVKTTTSWSGQGSAWGSAWFTPRQFSVCSQKCNTTG